MEIHAPRSHGCHKKDQRNRDLGASPRKVHSPSAFWLNVFCGRILRFGASANSMHHDFAEVTKRPKGSLANPRSAVWMGHAGNPCQTHSPLPSFKIPFPSPKPFAHLLWAYAVLDSSLSVTEPWNFRAQRRTENGLDQIKGADPASRALVGSTEAIRIMKRKHAELPGEPAANNSVLLTTKVRDRDKGTEKWRKTG